MSAPEWDRPVVEVAKAVVPTLQLVLFVALAVGPLLAGFLVPLGPPQHTARLVEVSPAAGADGVEYAALSPAAQADLDVLIEAPEDRITRRDDDPSALFDGETVVEKGEYAFRVRATTGEPPLRKPLVVAGLLVSVLGTLLGGAVVSRDLV